MLLIFKTFAEILRFSPSLKDIIPLKHISDNTGNIFGDILLVKPHGVENYLIPTDVIQLIGEPNFSSFNNFVLNVLVGMTIFEKFLVNISFAGMGLTVNLYSLVRLFIIRPVQMF